jgi:hypothetical protein
MYPDDAKIVAIRDDELKHAEELRQAMKLVLAL